MDAEQLYGAQVEIRSGFCCANLISGDDLLEEMAQTHTLDVAAHPIHR